jgi:hypothetical protein
VKVVIPSGFSREESAVSQGAKQISRDESPRNDNFEDFLLGIPTKPHHLFLIAGFAKSVEKSLSSRTLRPFIATFAVKIMKSCS